MIPLPPTSTLFPYTTLFRSHYSRHHGLDLRRQRRVGQFEHNPDLQVLSTITAGVGEIDQNFRHVQEDRSLDSRNLRDRKSTRLNSSHVEISYAVFCLKKKNK